MSDLIDALMFFGAVTAFALVFTLGCVLFMAIRFHFEGRRERTR